MKFQVVSLFLTTVLSVTLALKSPSLCTGGTGNTLVCTVISHISQTSSINTDGISVAQKGQEALFNDLKSLKALATSFKTQTDAEAEKTTDKQWARFLKQASEKLSTASYRSENLLYNIVSSIRNFQSALTESNQNHEDRIEKTAKKATYGLKQTGVDTVNKYVNTHKAELKSCEEGFVGELETLQKKTADSVEGYYGATIDLLDQIGQCSESSVLRTCSRDAKRKLTKINSLPAKFSVDGAKFTAMGRRSFDKYPCTVRSVNKFNNELRKFSRNASTTAAPAKSTAPTNSSSNSL